MNVTCETYPYLIKDDFFCWCGLERTDLGDTDVSINGEPLKIQPDWCKLKEEYND